MDFINFIRLWNILLNEDFKQKLKLLFVSHLKGEKNVRNSQEKWVNILDEKRREIGVASLLELPSARLAPLNIPAKQEDSYVSTEEQSTTDEVKEAENPKPKPSQLPLMNQVNL